MAKSQTVKLTAPNGASVTVGEDRVTSLVRFGFTETAAPKPAKKTAAKKAASSKSEK